MSDKYNLTTKDVEGAVNQMMADKYNLSLIHYNSIYFYAHDKMPIVTLAEYKDDRKGTVIEPSLQLSNIPDVYSIKIDNDFYKELIFLIGRQYDYNMANKTPRATLSMTDVKNYYESKKHLGDQDAALLLICHMIKHRCPIDVINRTYYLFDNPNEKTSKGLFDCKNKLVKFDSKKCLKWFFVGNAGTRTFSEFDKRSQKLFDFVEKAYQKQHN